MVQDSSSAGTTDADSHVLPYAIGSRACMVVTSSRRPSSSSSAPSKREPVVMALVKGFLEYLEQQLMLDDAGR